MSSFNLEKKHKPAHKAWKSLVKTLCLKLESLNISRVVKKTTHCLVKSSKSFCCLHRSGQHFGYNHLKMKSDAIYVDELYGLRANKVVLKKATGPTRSTRANDPIIGANTMPPKQKEHGLGRAIDDVAISRRVKESQTNTVTLADEWKNIEMSKLKSKGIDEKAEEFITKFREDLKLQNEKSILEFQEMLARSY